MIRVSLLALLTFLVLPAWGKNLGVYGNLFPVLEQNLLEFIMQKLKAMEASGELKKQQETIANRVAEQVIRPKPLALKPTTSPVSFSVDPSVVLNQDLYLPDGHLIAKAGTKLNPFEHLNFKKTLIFFNADDRKQLAWVKKHYQDYAWVKFILTGGDVRETTESLGRVYFDLDGRLSQGFKLQHVPSLVYQKGLSWQIEEVGDKDA